MLVNITNLDEFGRGITRINGKVSFVINALPNEEVEAEIIEEKSKYNILKSNKIVKKSDDRQDAICPYYLECGGCNIMHLKYEKQLEYKL
jgi:23S rRNA (uracil1939-C5)-methyltransferase